MKFETEQQALDYLEFNGCDEFDGMDCNDYEQDEPCSGWFGGRRCDCGKRRIQLLTTQDLHGLWTAYAYASAY